MNMDALNNNRYETSSPLNFVWNDIIEEPFGLDLSSIRDSAFPENGSELVKFGNEAPLVTHEDTSRPDRIFDEDLARTQRSVPQARGRRARTKKPLVENRGCTCGK